MEYNWKCTIMICISIGCLGYLVSKILEGFFYLGFCWVSYISLVKEEYRGKLRTELIVWYCDCSTPSRCCQFLAPARHEAIDSDHHADYCYKLLRYHVVHHMYHVISVKQVVIKGVGRSVTGGYISLWNSPHSNRAKSHSSITSIPVVKSFWNFAQSMAVTLPCSVQNLKMIWQQKIYIIAN